MDMRPTDGQSVSEWMATAKTSPHAPLTEDAKADVCIVGAGIAGMTAAYMLTRQGKSVVVLDDGPVGGGETQRTTAHIANALDERFFDLEKMHGKDGAKLAAESHTSAIDFIEHVVGSERIDCGFERLDGFLFLPAGESVELLERERDAASRAGLFGVQLLEKLPVDFFDFGPCLVFPHQAQFHPLLYLEGLSRAIAQGGGRICNETHVTKLKEGTPARVTVKNGATVEADSVIIATNAPINDGFPIYSNQAGYRTFVIAAKIPHGSVFKALYWDTPDPYHYIRIHETDDGDTLIVGGEDHKTGQANDANLRYHRLETWMRKHFPMAEAVLHQWSGQVMIASDGMGLIGRYPADSPNVYIATGDCGNGMTHGTIAGLLLPDLILGKKNPWEKLYAPSRFTRAPRQYAKENLNVAKQFLDIVTKGSRMPEVRIPLDSGTVVRRGFKKIAVYRDEHGDLHEFSAFCPHKGCVVQWNSAEKSWDCPCHGSRFDCKGAVLNGPSIENLHPTEQASIPHSPKAPASSMSGSGKNQ